MIQNSLITEDMLDPDLLRSFLAVVDCGSFQSAAEQVGRTAAAVSMQIKRLEERVGTTLMLRNNQGIRLTPAGERLLAYAERLVRLNSEALAAIQSQTVSGRIRIGIPAESSNPLLRHILPLLHSRFPELKPRITGALSRDLRRLLKAGDIDMAIVSCEPDLPAGRLVAKQAHGYWQARGLVLRDDAPLPLVVFGDDCLMRELPFQHIKQAGLPHEVTFSANSTDAMVAAVENGMGVALLPNHLCLDNPALIPANRPGLPESLSLGLEMISGQVISRDVEAEIAAVARAALPQA